MTTRSSIFSAPQIAAHAPQAAGLIDLEVVDETGSTNADLVARLPQLERPVCRLAHQQTAGRGRDGRQWLSTPDGSLTFSLAWCFRRPLHELGGLPLAAGVAVAAVLKRFHIDVRLKWPNDVLKDGRKLAGILTESTTSAATGSSAWVVIGIGINLDLDVACRNQIDQPISDLPELDAADRPRLVGMLLEELVRTLAQFDQEGFAPFMERWNANHAHAGQEVDILERGRIVHAGTAHGVDEAGRLVLQSAAGPVSILSGEVSLRQRPVA